MPHTEHPMGVTPRLWPPPVDAWSFDAPRARGQLLPPGVASAALDGPGLVPDPWGLRGGRGCGPSTRGASGIGPQNEAPGGAQVLGPFGGTGSWCRAVPLIEALCLGAAAANVSGGRGSKRVWGGDTSRSTGRSGRQKAATRRNMRREERVTVQGPVKKQ